MKWILEQADFVIYQSEFCKTSADQFLLPCKKSWTVLHNPVDTEYFVPAISQPSGLKLLLAGSHHEFYRVKTAIEMMPYLLIRQPDAMLTIAGRCVWKHSSEACVGEAMSLAKALKVSNKILFQGSYTQNEALSLFQNHHILIHTQYNDSCPRLVVEAMACGLPVVYSSSGGVPELVGAKGGVGIFAPLDWQQKHPPAPEELAKAVEKVVGNLESYRVEARSRAVQRYDVRPWRDRHEEIFHQLLRERKDIE